AMHREPVVIKGRTIRSNGTSTTVVPNAAVSVTGIWRTAPPANVVVPPDPPNILSLNPPLYSNRTTGAPLRRRPLTPVVDPLPSTKRLVRGVQSGFTTIRVGNRVGLSTTSILLVDAENADRAERIKISAIAGGSDPSEPA